MPEFMPVHTRVPVELFGDAVMILEFAYVFKSIFDFKQFFPKGFTWSKCCCFFVFFFFFVAVVLLKFDIFHIHFITCLPTRIDLYKVVCLCTFLPRFSYHYVRGGEEAVQFSSQQPIADQGSAPPLSWTSVTSLVCQMGQGFPQSSWQWPLQKKHSMLSAISFIRTEKMATITCSKTDKDAVPQLTTAVKNTNSQLQKGRKRKFMNDEVYE